MVSGLLSRLRRLMPPGGHAFAGLVLLAVAATAMAIANSPLDQPWQALLDRSLLPGNGQPLLLTPRAAINEGLMAVFFFAIGLEIKREVLVGDLAHAPTRRLPVLAAAAGMAGPALEAPATKKVLSADHCSAPMTSSNIFSSAAVGAAWLLLLPLLAAASFSSSNSGRAAGGSSGSCSAPSRCSNRCCSALSRVDSASKRRYARAQLTNLALGILSATNIRVLWAGGRMTDMVSASSVERATQIPGGVRVLARSTKLM